jgi:hypothetical protein
VNSIPIFDTQKSAVLRRVLNELCDPPVGWSWPTLQYVIYKNGHYSSLKKMWHNAKYLRPDMGSVYLDNIHQPPLRYHNFVDLHYSYRIISVFTHNVSVLQQLPLLCWPQSSLSRIIYRHSTPSTQSEQGTHVRYRVHMAAESYVTFWFRKHTGVTWGGRKANGSPPPPNIFLPQNRFLG